MWFNLTICSGDGVLSAMNFKRRKLKQQSDQNECDLLCAAIVKVRFDIVSLQNTSDGYAQQTFVCCSCFFVCCVGFSCVIPMSVQVIVWHGLHWLLLYESLQLLLGKLDRRCPSVCAFACVSVKQETLHTAAVCVTLLRTEAADPNQTCIQAFFVRRVCVLALF